MPGLISSLFSSDQPENQMATARVSDLDNDSSGDDPSTHDNDGSEGIDTLFARDFGDGAGEGLGRPTGADPEPQSDDGAQGF